MCAASDLDSYMRIGVSTQQTAGTIMLTAHADRRLRRQMAQIYNETQHGVREGAAGVRRTVEC